MGLFGRTSDSTLDADKVRLVATTYGYSDFEVRSMTRELRTSFLKAIDEGDAPAAPIVRPEQAVTAKDVSVFENFKDEVVARTKSLLPKLGLIGALGVGALLIGLVSLAVIKAKG